MKRFYYVSASRHSVHKLHIAKKLGDGEILACGRRMWAGWKWFSKKDSLASVCKSCAARGA